MFFHTNKRGFTLIEILVVLGIIAVLLAVIYANFTDARVSAKNKAVRTELKEMQLVIEQYKAQNGRYPETAYIDGVPGCRKSHPPILTPNYYSSTQGDCGADLSLYPIVAGVVPEYIDQIPDPADSANSACEYTYYVAADGSWYKLVAENCLGPFSGPASGIQANDEMAVCSPLVCGLPCVQTDADFYNSLAIYSSAGQCQAI